jgi:hypothetical protein
MQNLQCQSAENNAVAPDIIATPQLTVVPATGEIPTDPTIEEENLWDVWPYCWATAAWDLTQNRFHSFHKKLSNWRLARANRRDREKFQAEFWQAWSSRNEGEGQDLRLV